MAEPTPAPQPPSSPPHLRPRTQDQIRAAFAWACINQMKPPARTGDQNPDPQKQDPGDDQKRGQAQPRSPLGEYRDLVRKLPAMIQTNGLGQALAFLAVQKGEKAHLYRHLNCWLTGAALSAGRTDSGGDAVRNPFPPYPPSVPGEGALLQLTQTDSLTLRRATRDALAVAEWLKRFAEAAEVEEKAAKTAGAAHGTPRQAAAPPTSEGNP